MNQVAHGNILSDSKDSKRHIAKYKISGYNPIAAPTRQGAIKMTKLKCWGLFCSGAATGLSFANGLRHYLMPNPSSAWWIDGSLAVGWICLAYYTIEKEGHKRPI